MSPPALRMAGGDDQNYPSGCDFGVRRLSRQKGKRINNTHG
jgi:hypothetical protein